MRPPTRRAWRVLIRRLWGPLVAAALLALVAGCAAIPDQTLPQVIQLGAGQDARDVAVQPPKGAGPLDIVRDFVNSSANPAGGYAGARAYLADPTKPSWGDNSSLTIIGDSFSTTPGSEVAHDNNHATVILRARDIGRLGADRGFQPGAGEFEAIIHLARQLDGEWRITDPPDSPLIVDTLFVRNYRPVRVYFFDPSVRSLVPDLRYVAGYPQNAVPGRVIDLLLAGPSTTLANGAVTSAIPDDVTTKQAVTQSPDGAIVVNLTRTRDPAGQTDHGRQLMIAQIVWSLQAVSSSPVRVESEGVPLIAGHGDWRLADLPAYDVLTVPKADLPGLVVTDGRVVTLNDATPVPGPAGSGQYQVITAAQPVGGGELALVCRTATGQLLRVGNYGAADGVVDLKASQFTRPTWMPGDAAGSSHEVWTVADGQVVRVVDTQQGSWVATPVDASALTGIGPITDLRLSRDGVRVAAVVGGALYVGSVVTGPSAVSIKNVVRLRADVIVSATRLDWLDQNTLVVATDQATLPVARVSVDGLTMNGYNTSNLTAPLTAITAAPGRPVLVVDSGGMWSSSDPAEVWQNQPRGQGSNSVPFYPG